MAKVKHAPVRIIASKADIRAGVRALRRACPLMRTAHGIAGDPPLRRSEGGFRGLARIIVGQQLSIASAAAIWSRVERLSDPFDAAGLVQVTDDVLREAGLSRPKIKTLRALSAAVLDGRLDVTGLDDESEAAVHAALRQVPGIGPWTADIYLMFCLGRADAFAPGDLALQVAAGMLMGGDERLSPSTLSDLAERWRPWRGVAARLLWAYYKVARAERSGTPI